MLLTLRTPESPTSGFVRLPGTVPAAVLTIELPEGQAHLFHPAENAVAVILEPDPATPRGGSPGPSHSAYAAGAGALLGAALGRLFASAPSPEDDVPRLIEARLSAFWCPAGESMLARVVGPMGYTLDATRLPVEPERPQVGKSPFYSVVLSGHHRLREVLSHLRVLLPLFDDQHLRMRGGDAGEVWEEARAWLETHPERELLEWRLLGRLPRSQHHDLRHEVVVETLRESGARRVLDLGCGAGRLLRRLTEESQFEEVVGVEVARDELAEAASRLPASGRARALHGSLAYGDARLVGFDAAALVEVIEHMDPPQLAALEGAVWETARPATVVVTTPNADYNTLFGDRGKRMRHPDHRFEWTRAEFRAWAEEVAGRHGYAVRFAAAGPEAPHVGALSQMAVFERLSEASPPGTSSGAGGDGPPGPHAGIHLEDVAGDRIISTRLADDVHVTAEQTAEALEVMSRFAVDPRWLVYLPPATPAAVTVPGSDALEHPLAALAYYRANGLARVALQPLHSGTRIALVVCRDAEGARRRFRIAAGETGAVYTVTGRPFFATQVAEEAFLARVRRALDGGRVWEQLATDWVALEGVIGPGVPVMDEVNPRLRPPPALYRAVTTATRTTLEAAEAALALAVAAGVDATALLARTHQRSALVTSYMAACRRAVSSAQTADQLRLTPIRLLAGEGAVYAEGDPCWHEERLAPACHAAPHTLLGADQTVIDLAHRGAEADTVAWWETALAQGRAGIVVRPLERASDGEIPSVAPALKCRNEDALLLAHGPEPILPEQRGRLRGRRMDEEGGRAAREWALSIEALERFVRGEPTARVHECVFAALALKLGSSG
ncbi:MAG TPA: methyltransferase domain-containing protein [Longimicrobium sp.]|nr:methyltransferase domain-containing protein [Longimicrobium sp.]